MGEVQHKKDGPEVDQAPAETLKEVVQVRPGMRRREVILADGRSLFYYEFDRRKSPQ